MSHEARTGAAVPFVRFLALLSLLALIVPNANLLAGPAAPRATQVRAPFGDWAWLAIVVAVMALYLLYWMWIWPGPATAQGAVLLAGMVALAAVGEWVAPPPVATGLWLYPAVVAGCVLPSRWAMAAVVVLALVAAASILVLQPPAESRAAALPRPLATPRLALPRPLATPRLTLPRPVGPLVAGATLTQPLGTAQAAAPVLIGGFGAMLVTLLLRTNAELRAARAAVARMAVEQERTRLARDLHDLLGHNLSFLAVKLELARRLVGRADHPAAVELEEAHRMARSALRDVREAVGGYRQPTLEGELAGARLALEAAGIDLVVHDEHGVLSSEVEAACAWVVREGVTNVIEHSGARVCRIDIRRLDGSLTATIADDGTGDDVRAGMGLKGLEERVSALGGTLSARRSPSGGGFQLVARIPAWSTKGAERGPD
jgi:signal transduction histidine kinase